MNNQRRKIRFLVSWVACLWVLEAFDQIFLRGRLDLYGIQPRSVGGLRGILFAPFLHGDFGHLASNTIPLLVLGWLVLLPGVTEFVEVTLLVMLLGGVGTWLFGAPNTVHIGASGVIFGYLGFLLLRGVFQRSVTSIVIALGVGLLYGGVLWGILPRVAHVSWEAHLCGFLSGATVAWGMARGAGGRRPRRHSL